MKRREFLGGLGALALSSWVVDSFAIADKIGPAYKARVPLLFDSYRRARRTGQPLLVLVIPRDDQQKSERGALWGAFLNFGSSRQLAPLAQCEVVCATADELHKLVPNAGKGEPLAVLVETSALPATTQGVRVKLEPIASTNSDWYAMDAELDAMIDAQTARVARALEHAIVPNAELAARRANESAAVHGHADAAKKLVATIASGGAVKSEQVDAYSAEIMQALLAATDRKARRRMSAQLGKVVRRELKDQRVPGSRWANGGGCGVDIEGEDSNIAIGCGMGHAPEKSQRFLYFFAKGPYEQ
jgi:hypothetical protein